ncbi:hypothetical protein BSK66_10020 [Paenibacillus odorifer]|uniref:Uncharacterized protein n=1 Tax=Paenibacillus odorifer TaxID=189426 RepID=A0A1R0XDS5_9BACL|nr:MULTISPECIES: hypothetical protein [Paenibacillus]ETT45442.1 hypothetical protein C171_32136 [Paenibacillus sp. FSL H8-237]OMD33197.1 hypothetical protein BJP51_12605 [Paenibacillus odorifer]OME59676.1 hypothetical protein BSK66_10020 [Paenibacillus odorifer]
MKQTSKHMMDRPYIKNVIHELQRMGYEEDSAKKVLLKYYRPLKRTWGFEPNAIDFAKEIISVDNAVKRLYDPKDPNQVFIGHLKGRINSKK